MGEVLGVRNSINKKMKEYIVVKKSQNWTTYLTFKVLENMKRKKSPDSWNKCEDKTRTNMRWLNRIIFTHCAHIKPTTKTNTLRLCIKPNFIQKKIQHGFPWEKFFSPLLSCMLIHWHKARIFFSRWTQTCKKKPT